MTLVEECEFSGYKDTYEDYPSCENNILFQQLNGAHDIHSVMRLRANSIEDSDPE